MAKMHIKTFENSNNIFLLGKTTLQKIVCGSSSTGTHFQIQLGEAYKL